MDDPKNTVTALSNVASRRVAATPRAAEARALRAEHARAAAYQARLVEQARTAAHDVEAARWREEYRRSVARWRLGNLIRAGSQSSAVANATASTVTPLVQPEPGNRDPTTGEAA